MFYYLNGTITVIEAGFVVVDCGGVGFGCFTTGYTISDLRLGQQKKLYTY